MKQAGTGRPESVSQSSLTVELHPHYVPGHSSCAVCLELGPLPPLPSQLLSSPSFRRTAEPRVAQWWFVEMRVSASTELG